MSLPSNGIFIQKDVFSQRLRVLEKVAKVTPQEAAGMIVDLWMIGAEIADENGKINPNDDRAYDILRDGNLESFELSGLIHCDDDAIMIVDFDEIIVPARRLKEHDDKLEKKRHLDMLRKQRKRAEQKKATPKQEPPSPGSTEQHPNPSAIPPEPHDESLPEPPKEKPKRKKNPTVPKIAYSDHVHMTEVQYGKLVAQYGEAVAAEAVRTLNSYKGSKGKSYKDDYLAILSWVIDALKAKKPGLFRAVTTTTEWHDDNPF